LASKADRHGVPSLEQYHEMRSRMPTIEQHEELKQAVLGKAERHEVPTFQHYNELCARVPTMDQHEELRRSIAAKAEKHEVATHEHLRQLRGQMPTMEQHEELGKAVERSLGQTAPTIKMLEGMLTTLESTFTGQLQELSGTVASKLLEERAASAASRAEVDEILSKQRSAIAALDRQMVEKAMRGDVPSLEQFGALATSVKGKADGNWAEQHLKTLSGLISEKVGHGEAPTTASFESLCNTMSEKADIAWTQEQIRGITDILLPLSRAVRNLNMPGAKEQSVSALSTPVHTPSSPRLSSR